MKVVEKATQLLSRLPSTAPDILDALPFNTDTLQGYHFHAAGVEGNTQDEKVSIWLHMRVVHHVGDYVLRCALHIVIGSGVENKAVDSIMAILRLSLQLSAEEGMQDDKWLIVCSFLWTSWQRCLMIYLWVNMASQLDGFDYQSTMSLRLKGIDLIPTIFQSRSRQLQEELHRVPYLCGWAFRDLRNDRANVAMDLRHFHELYYYHFGKRQPLCNGIPTQCDGSSSKECRRFRDTRTENQPMHDHACKGSCPRLFWSRESFVSVVGPKAVDPVATDSSKIRYCKFTENTLTVSHVWSHGQVADRTT